MSLSNDNDVSEEGIASEMNEEGSSIPFRNYPAVRSAFQKQRLEQSNPTTQKHGSLENHQMQQREMQRILESEHQRLVMQVLQTQHKGVQIPQLDSALQPDDDARKLHLMRRIQEDERQRLGIQILQSQQHDAQLRQRQQHRPIGIQPLVNTAAAALVQLQGRRPSQQSSQQQVQQNQLRHRQLQQLVAVEQQTHRDEAQLAAMLQVIQHRDRYQALLQHQNTTLNSSHSIANIVASLPVSRSFGAPANINATGVSRNDMNGLGLGAHSIRNNIDMEMSLRASGSLNATDNVAEPTSRRSGIDMRILQSLMLDCTNFKLTGNTRDVDASLPMSQNLSAAANIAATGMSAVVLNKIHTERFRREEEKDVTTFATSSKNDDEKSECSDHGLLQPWSDTSAEVLKTMQVGGEKSGVTTGSPKEKSSLRKKVEGVPKRPLHAYNVFFQEERQRILSGLPSPPMDDEACKYVMSGKRKRKRRATHGKISFSSLAKSIAEKWKSMGDEEKVHYQQMAEKDLQRYHDEMTAHNIKVKETQIQTLSAPAKGVSKDKCEENNIESTDADTNVEDKNEGNTSIETVGA